MQTDFSILTPDKVVVTCRLGSVGSRILAALLDFLIVGALLVLITILMALTIQQYFPELAAGLQLLILSFGFVTYFSLFEGLWNGQTPGKRTARLRVRMADGTPVTFSAAVFRNMLRIADFFPILYITGLIAIFLNPKSQRLGDLAAGTIVVHEPAAIPQFSPAPHKFGLHPFEPHVGELRRMSQDEYFAIKRLCDRFPELGQTVQQKMLRDIWNPFAEKHEIKPLLNVHPVYLMEAVIMSYGRVHGLL